MTDFNTQDESKKIKNFIASSKLEGFNIHDIDPTLPKQTIKEILEKHCVDIQYHEIKADEAESPGLAFISEYTNHLAGNPNSLHTGFYMVLDEDGNILPPTI